MKEGDMAEGRFTPGPWVVQKDGSLLCGETYRDLSGVSRQKHVARAYMRKNDAHLIAAAPEMYAALSAFSDAIKVGGKDELREALEMARASLAKAEGRDA